MGAEESHSWAQVSHQVQMIGRCWDMGKASCDDKGRDIWGGGGGHSDIKCPLSLEALLHDHISNISLLPS